MKKIILALLLLLIAGCSTETVILEEVTDNIITGSVVAEPIDTTPYYDFFEGETKNILGHSITVSDINNKPEVSLIIDGISGKLLETKNEEIINYMKVSISKFDFSDSNEKKVTLKIEEANLENNQYVIYKYLTSQIKNKDVILTESKSNGMISVSVYDINTEKGDDENIAIGETVEIYGLKITNLKNYYRTNQYAIVEIQESS